MACGHHFSDIDACRVAFRPEALPDTQVAEPAPGLLQAGPARVYPGASSRRAAFAAGIGRGRRGKPARALD